MLIRTLLFATENTSEYVNSPWRALNLRTRASTSTRFNLKVFVRVVKKDSPEIFNLLFFTQKVSSVIYNEGG